MMFDGGWPNLSRGRAIVLILAVVGLGWLLLRVNHANPSQISLWNGMLANASGGAVEANALKGFAVQTGQGMRGDLMPHGNPLNAPNTVMTQGYGVGSHAPANVWGAIDLALDGDSDGQADPGGTWNRPVHATNPGVVTLTSGSWPAGNHIWVANDQYKTGYAHLQEFAVSDGQQVERGQVIGYIGSTGQSTGPHLDYQIWHVQDGRWVNVNPLDFGAFEAIQ